MSGYLELTDRVFAVLRDSERVFVLETEVGEWLNEAQLDVVARTGILKKTDTGTTTSLGTVALPTDFIRETAFSVATTTANVNESPELTNDEIFLSWKNAAATPSNTLARIFNENIETYPAVVSKAYSLEYIRKPLALVVGTDVPEIPEELHIRLVNYARAQAKWKEGEQGEGDRYWALYMEGMPTAPTAQYRTRPGPFSFIPESSYWE